MSIQYKEENELDRTRQIVEVELDRIRLPYDEPFSVWIQVLIDLREKYKDCGNVRISTEEGYLGEHHLELTGEREETDQELAKRLAHELSDKVHKDKNERREYERLKKKFEA